MECLDTTSSLKINYKRNIGTVVVAVEGSKDEFKILKQIFRNVLHYRYIEKSRNKKNFKDYDEFVMKGNENSKVIVINLKNSNIKDIQDDSEYKDELFKLLYIKYDIDIKNIPLYIIWDRDKKSNSKTITKELIKTLGNAYENKNANMNGLLLLSYPSIESFIIENFDQRIKTIGNNNIKEYVSDYLYYIDDISNHTLLKSVVKFHKNLREFGIIGYDTSDCSELGLKIFEEEEQIYNKKGYYQLLSFVVVILIDLNIITER